MEIEEVIEMIEDAKYLSNSNKEYNTIIKNFIKNFKDEYVILDKNDIYNEETFNSNYTINL